MEVMKDVLVGWVQMSRYPSCFVSKAVARAGSATGGLTKIARHHEFVCVGSPGERTAGRDSDRGSEFFSAVFSADDGQDPNAFPLIGRPAIQPPPAAFPGVG